MKKIILAFCLLISIIKADTINLDLVAFSSFVAENNNISILIDDKLKDEKFNFTIAGKEDYLLTAFKRALNLKDLDLIKEQNFYYVTKKEIYVELPKTRYIKINLAKYEDIKQLLNLYPDLKYEFIPNNKTLILYSTESQYQSIYAALKQIDYLPAQYKLKITIVETNINKLKEFGVDYQFNLESSKNNNLFFNLISLPFSVNNTLDSATTNQFYAYLKATNQNDLTEILSNPILTITDNKETVFESVDTIPFKNSTTKIENTQVVTSDSIDYKDVGFTITVKPYFYSMDNVYLDLNLNISNLLSVVDNVPTTTKKQLKQSFKLKIGESLILTGINKKFDTENKYGIPVLEDIPVLGKLFSYESITNNQTNLSIVFEILKN